MKYVLRWLTLAAFPVLAQSAGVTPLTIYTNFEQPPAEASFHVIRAEVERMMAPLVCLWSGHL